MKTLLLFLLLISLNVRAQSDYDIDKNATIYDISNGELLTAVVINDTIFIKHLDTNGDLIWQDFLTFSPQFTPVHFNEITRFKNTDEYIISALADVSPQTPYLQNYQTDTLIYEFTKLNLANHTFTGNLVDTFSCYATHLVEVKDTSLYLLVASNTVSPNQYKYTTYSLNPSLEINLVAPLDSMSCAMQFWTEYVYDDTMYRLHNISHFLNIDKYTADISLIQSIFTSVSTSEYFNDIFFRKPINKDSLFIFTEGRANGFMSKHWKMNWFDLNLNSLHSAEFETPKFSAGSDYYSVNFNAIEIDQINKQILVMATYWLTTTSSNNPQKIFVYDYNFNLVCEIPVKIGRDDINSLISLNNRVYLKVSNPTEDLLFELNCNLLGMDEFASNFKFELFPNPAESNINLSNPESKELTISLLTPDGKQISEMTEQASLISIKLNHLPSGIYLVKISDGLNGEIKRIIKE
jgi:hypothetical protein